jgi:hypothetical protein
MALSTYLGLLPLVYFVPPVIENFVKGRLTVTAISLALIVPFMSYFLLPTVGKIINKR